MQDNPVGNDNPNIFSLGDGLFSESEREAHHSSNALAAAPHPLSPLRKRPQRAPSCTQGRQPGKSVDLAQQWLPRHVMLRNPPRALELLLMMFLLLRLPQRRRPISQTGPGWELSAPRGGPEAPRQNAAWRLCYGFTPSQALFWQHRRTLRIGAVLPVSPDAIYLTPSNVHPGQAPHSMNPSSRM